MRLESSNKIELKISGQLCSKSNSRQLILRGKHPRIIKSKAALEYVKESSIQIKRQLKNHKPFEDYVRLEVHVWYASRRPDLDISLIQDVLQENGIYQNDRQVVEIHAFKYRDTKNPRIIVRISEIDNEELKNSGLL